jgi:lipoprotein-releasing system ATP-binding protein
MSELRATGVKKHFAIGERQLEILRGVDVAVGPGDSLAILGVSGAGKSTLLHVLGGLEHPSEGSVSYDGRDVYALPPNELARMRNQALGFVFQFHHLLPEFDAEENVMMPCLLGGLGQREARERAAAMLAAVGLADRRDHRPGKLSGGERQRVAFARALVMNPRVVLADEPTGNLDPRTAGEVGDLLLRLNSDAGTALILVTHNHELARRLAKTCYLNDGVLEW